MNNDPIKNKIFCFLFLFFSIFVIQAQNPAIEWSKCVGGTRNDDATSIIQTSDGGYIAVGHTSSIDFDAIENDNIYGGCFVVKFSNIGVIEWKRCLGGTGGEYYPTVIETNEGEYIISCCSNSIDGDITNSHGDYDVWVVKLDQLGNIIWQKCYGGTNIEKGRDIIQTSDSGYIIVGYTSSYDGDLLNLNFYENYQQGWILKIDSIGTIQWQKLIGGSGEDLLFSIQNTFDGGYIVAGTTTSHDGDVIGNNGVESAWVVKISDTGTIQWQNCIGSGSLSQATDVIQCSDNGYIVTCEKMIPVGSEMMYSHGYVIKLSNTGNIEWEKQLGGSRDDYLSGICQTEDGGFIVGGASGSTDGDLIGIPYLGNLDYWIIKLGENGNIEWQKRFGGYYEDRIFSILQTADNGYILAGESSSNNNDVIGQHTTTSYYHYYDMWIVKISPTVSIENFDEDKLIQIYPNPTNSILNIDVPLDFLNQQYQIITIFGQIINSDIITTEHTQLNVNHLPKGIYFFQIGQTKRSNMFVVN